MNNPPCRDKTNTVRKRANLSLSIPKDTACMFYHNPSKHALMLDAGNWFSGLGLLIDLFAA